MAEAKPRLSTADRLKLIQTLNALPPTQFDELVFALQPPSGNIPGNAAPQGNRSAALLQWVESPIGPGLTDLEGVLAGLMGTHTSSAELPAAQQQTVEALVAIIQTLSQNQGPKYDLRGAQFAGGFAETVYGDQVGGNVVNQTFHGSVGNVAGTNTGSMTAYINHNSDDISRLLTALREMAQRFPEEQREEALMELEDLEADLKTPGKREPKRIGRRLQRLMALGAETTFSENISEFTGNVLELAVKVGLSRDAVIQPRDRDHIE